MPKKAKELSALAVSKLKTKGRYAVGGVDGLHLFIVGNSRTWILRIATGIRTNRKGETVVRRRDMGLGSYPEISLAEARDKARDMRKQVKSGIDPIEQKKRSREILRTQQRQAKTFRECADAVIENKTRELKNIRNQVTLRRSIETYVLPLLGDRVVGTITTADVAAVLKPIWHTKFKTAQELRGRIEAIFDYAKAMGYREGENPSAWKGVLKPILGKVKYKAKPYPALPYDRIGAFMCELRKQNDMAARALEYIILTATRCKETLGAVWEEIDFSKKIWTIPAERMKAKKEHRVPLSAEAVKLLESLPRSTDSPYVFPSLNGKQIARTTVGRMISRKHKADIQAGGKGYLDPKLNEVATVHGFRSTFRDWAAETTDYTWEICEYALAHKLLDKVEESYQRGDLLGKRTRLMADWAQYCGKAQTTGQGKK